VEYLVVFGMVYLPALLAIGEGVFGAYQARVGLRKRSFPRVAWGGALALGALVVAGYVHWLYLNTYSWGGFWILYAWAAPTVLVPGAALVLGCLATLVGARRRAALEARGFTQLPRPAPTRAAAAVLATALVASGVAFTTLVAIPAWHLWPYQSLSADYNTSDSILEGFPRFGERRSWEAICVIHRDEDTEWRAQYWLELDEDGMLVIETQRARDVASKREWRVPFEKCDYWLRNGELEREAQNFRPASLPSPS
jgi:hypothetical protein